MYSTDFIDALQEYFRGEKQESLVIAAASAVLLIGGGWLLLTSSQPFARGVAWVLLATALLGAAVGGTIIVRTGSQVAGLLALYERDRPRFVAEENARMQAVVRSFRAYRIAYAAAVGGALLLLLLSRDSGWSGVAVGLLVFAALGFTVDHFAEDRAIWYAGLVADQVLDPEHAGLEPSRIH